MTEGMSKTCILRCSDSRLNHKSYLCRCYSSKQSPTCSYCLQLAPDSSRKRGPLSLVTFDFRISDISSGLSMASFHCDALSAISRAPSQRAVVDLLLLDLLAIVLPSSTILSHVSSDSCLPTEQFFGLNSTPVYTLLARAIYELRQIPSSSAPFLPDATS